jgi:hypothetical protein
VATADMDVTDVAVMVDTVDTGKRQMEVRASPRSPFQVFHCCRGSAFLTSRIKPKTEPRQAMMVGDVGQEWRGCVFE